MRKAQRNGVCVLCLTVNTIVSAVRAPPWLIALARLLLLLWFADDNSSYTIPTQTSALRKGGYVMLKEAPCKIVEMSTAKPGKHGHAKVHLTALDIFTGKKVEDNFPSTHTISVPIVTRTDYTVRV
jgi:hypothetical protein